MKRTLAMFSRHLLIAIAIILGSNMVAVADDYRHGWGGHNDWNDHDDWSDHNRHGRKHRNYWEHERREYDGHPGDVYVVEPRWERRDHYIVQRRHIPYRVIRTYPVFESYQQVQVNCIADQPIINTVIGGLAGGLIGNQFGRGHGRTFTTLGGIILGGEIANSFSIADRGCATQVLEYAAPGTQVSWRNPDNGYSYTVLPTDNFQDSRGRYCREYHSVAYIGSQQQETYGTACRQPDGAWEIMNTR